MKWWIIFIARKKKTEIAKLTELNKITVFVLFNKIYPIYYYGIPSLLFVKDFPTVSTPNI